MCKKWFSVNKESVMDLFRLIEIILLTFSIIFAYWTVTIANSAIQTQEKLNRPYLSITESKIIRVHENSNDYQIFFSIKNNGERPSTNVNMDFIIVPYSVNASLKYSYFNATKYNTIFVTTIAGGSENSNYLYNVELENATTFFVYNLSYTDPIINEKYEKKDFFHWNGDSSILSNQLYKQKFYTAMNLVNENEKMHILNYLDDNPPPNNNINMHS